MPRVHPSAAVLVAVGVNVLHARLVRLARKALAERGCLLSAPKKLRLTFADTETTGLADTVDEALIRDREVIEYAFVTWEDGDQVRSFERKVMPSPGQPTTDAEFCASKGWNHFTGASDWLVKVGEREYGPAKRWSLEDCDNVDSFLKGETLAGSNPGFDLNMFKAEFARLDRLQSFPKLATPRMLDIGQGAWFLFAAGLVDRTGLEPLAKYLGVEHKAHTAMGDVLACIGCFERLCDEYLFRPRKLTGLLRDVADSGGMDAEDCGALTQELAGLGAGL